MSTVAPSTPASAVVPSAGNAGEAADPAAFDAEFRTALTSLTTSTTGDSPDALPTVSGELAETVPTDTPALAAAPIVPALSGATEIPTPAAPELSASAAAAAPVGVISDGVISGGVESGGAASVAELAPAVVEPAESVTDTTGTDTTGTDTSGPDTTGPDTTDTEGAAPDAASAPALPVPPVAPAPASAALVGANENPATAPVVALDTITPAQVPGSVAAPLVPSIQAPADVAVSAAPARAPELDLVGQLSRPLNGLRSFGDGTHIITVRVNPENLGPVAVRAHVSGENMRIELVAPTEVAREAIKAILPDLRRDLSGSGGQATLDLSSGNQPSGRESGPRDAQLPSRRDDRMPVAQPVGIRAPSRSDVGLDVLA